MQKEFEQALTSMGLIRHHIIDLPGTMDLTFLFGAFVFLQFTVLGLANHAGEGYLTTALREQVYYALQVFVILGYLIHGFFFQICKAEKTRRAVLYAILALFFIFSALTFLIPRDSVISVIVSMAAALFLGTVGGAVHIRMSMATLSDERVARSMGVGSAVAVVLQYLFQLRERNGLLLPVFMLAAFILLISILPGKDLNIAGGCDMKRMTCKSRRIAFTVLIAIAFILLAGFYNETIHHLMIRSNYEAYNVYSWPRLMMVPGYLLFAVIGDRKKGKYVPIASLCIMLIAMLNVVLMGNSETYWLNMSLFYLAIAVVTSYYLLSFWRLAPGTEHPVIWASMGRVLDSGMVLFMGAVNFSALPVPVVLGADIAGVSMIILVMAVNGDLGFTVEPFDTAYALSEMYPERVTTVVGEKSPSEMIGDTTQEIARMSGGEEISAQGIVCKPAAEWPLVAESMQIPDSEKTLSQMQKKYQLTPREVEVLRELVLTEDKQSMISERLSIQIRTLQNHVTQLYRKTGVSTRAGLTELYYKNQNQP